MKNVFKIIAALAVLAGVCLLLLELMKKREEKFAKDKENRSLKRFIRRNLSDRAESGTIADYRFDDDDDYAEMDLPEEPVVIGDIVPGSIQAADDDNDAGVEFDLSEDALEQLLDS